MKDYKEITRLISEEAYIISDTHFFHENMLIYEPIRHGLSLKENVPIEDVLENNWNSIIGDQDIVFHLGDFAWKHISDISNQLNGRKILLKGNHDRSKPSVYQRSGWKLVDDIVIDVVNEFKVIELPKPASYTSNSNCVIKDIMGYRILFSHIPVLDDNQFDQKFQESRNILHNLFDLYKCDLNIHGHIHSKDAKGTMCFNVSVEKLKFKPMKLKDFLISLKK